MSKKILVIGAVALGPKAASRLRRLDPDAEITMIDENEYISFGGCGIPYYVSGEVNSLDALRATTYGTVRDPGYFEEKGIITRNRTRAISIDRVARTVLVEDLPSGEKNVLPYDKLVLATGSTPRTPPFPGLGLTNVTNATRLEAAQTMREACAGGSVSRAVVVGGGFIGLEMAVALKDMWDVDTAVVEFMDQLLPGATSPLIGDMVRNDLEQAGIHVFTSEKVLRLEGNNGENGAVTQVITDKHTLPADLVIFATGFTPNTALATAAGLDVDPTTGGIVVDEYMRTSDPHIFAGGDCVAVKNLITGKPGVFQLGSLANRQGRVIGTNLACPTGTSATFNGAVGAWAVKLVKNSACGVGLSLPRALSAGFEARAVNVEQLDRAHFYPEKAMMSLELVFDAKSRRVLGLQGFCEDGDALKARIDALSTMLQFGQPTIDDLSNAETAYAPPFSAALDTLNVVANVADNVLAGRLHPMGPAEFSRLWKNRAENDVYFADSRPAAAANKKAAEHPGEWHALPLEDLTAMKDTLPSDRPIALICNTGLRAYEVMLRLRRAGISNVTSSLGGMQTMLKRGEKL